MSSPLTDLDAVIHAPKRLAAMAVLAASSGTDFVFLRDHLQLSDSDLSKQMSALRAAGYVSVSKSGHGRGSTTTYTITRTGRAAYRRHRQALEALLHGERS
ncbi:transcriptional regulator [Actinotalea sp. K2]|uniref:transcriptional regulator n=1 Tax=Actinotalea sp. K2 TaxID=2939438 RepID=UPI0020174C5B|nr:transcriptional regulator [Actinotalea sp. K2]MCL3862531.1 transcriptional regulator [Actinotalea sp. K2]